MIFNFQAFFYALIFSGFLEFVAFFEFKFFYLFYLLFFIFLFAWFASQRIGRRLIFSFIPIIFSFSSTVLLYLIDLPAEKHFFILLSSLVFYLSLLGIYRLRIFPRDQSAKEMIAVSLMATVFLFFSSAFGIYLNFNIPVWVLVLIFMAVIYLISYEYLFIAAFFFKDHPSVFLYSFILAFSIAQLAWFTVFWPFGYLTTSTIILIFYYLLWDLAQTNFLRFFSQKRFLLNLIFFSLLALLALLSSKWRMEI